MVLKFPCKICNKAVANNHHTLQCRNCHLCVHIKCNRINFQTYKHLQNCSCTWYCLKCYEELIPFTTISDKELYQMNPGQKIKLSYYKNGYYSYSPIQDFIDQLNNAMDDPVPENISTKYYEPYEFTPLMKNTTNHMSFFYLNISSFCFRIEKITALTSEHDI